MIFLVDLVGGQLKWIRIGNPRCRDVDVQTNIAVTIQKTDDVNKTF